MATTVTSWPSRWIRPVPSGTGTRSPWVRSSRIVSEPIGANTTTGSSSLIAEVSSPNASDGVAGTTVFTP